MAALEVRKLGISCGHEGDEQGFDLIIRKTNDGQDRVMHHRITAIPSDFGDQRHPQGFDFPNVPDRRRTGDVKFPHDFGDGKVRPVVDVPHDGINPFNFFHRGS
ncbi:hypothetical protein D3C76_1305210 [compost metagenome]